MALKKLSDIEKRKEDFIKGAKVESIEIRRDSKKKKVKNPFKSIAKTYRLKQEDIERLRSLSRDINEKSITQISDTDIIRALICMGSKFKKTKIINTLKEI